MRKHDSLRLTYSYVGQFFADHGCELTGITSCEGRGVRSAIAEGSAESNNYQWIKNRVAKKEYDKFKEKCYKLLKIALHALGLKKNSRTESELGYTITDLQKHITSHPNWDKVKNESWHIDHIFPIKAFVDYGLKDVKLVNMLENLQPLSAKDNQSKNAKYDKELFEKWLRKHAKKGGV